LKEVSPKHKKYVVSSVLFALNSNKLARRDFSFKEHKEKLSLNCFAHDEV